MNKSSSMIMFAKTVSIPFKFQKNRLKMVTVTKPCSGKYIFPVVAWARIISCLLSYPSSTQKTYVKIVYIIKNTLYLMKGEDMFSHLRNTVDNMPGLGFKGDRVDTHLICSSLAVALYLARQPIPTIMLLGHWSSNAF